MEKEEKYLKLLEDKDELTKLIPPFEELTLKLVVPGEPKPYARERYTRFGRGNKGRFYNKRATYMESLKDEFRNQIDANTRNKLEKIMRAQTLNNKNDYFYYDISGEFYIKIPKNDSMKNRALKQLKIVVPTVSRGDVDNYIKLPLDVLHEVVYMDDKYVTNIHSSKYYSDEPRMELLIKIKYYIKEQE